MSYKWEWLGANTNVAVDGAELSTVLTELNATASEYSLNIDGNIINVIVKSGTIKGGI